MILLAILFLGCLVVVILQKLFPFGLMLCVLTSRSDYMFEKEYHRSEDMSSAYFSRNTTSICSTLGGIIIIYFDHMNKMVFAHFVSHTGYYNSL